LQFINIFKYNQLAYSFKLIFGDEVKKKDKDKENGKKRK